MKTIHCIDRDRLKEYFNWSMGVLCPLDPIKTDNYLRDNKHQLQPVVQELLEIIGYTPKTLYRGVLLKTDGLTELTPHPNFNYLSFSDKKSVAKHFADSSPNGFPDLFGLGRFGYVATRMPSSEEVVFHYEFLNLLPYKQVYHSIGITGFDTLIDQQEVTLLQPEVALPIVPFNNFN